MPYWTCSPISFDPTGTLLLRSSIPSFSIAGLSLRDLSGRLCLTCASRESVRIWVHRFSYLFRPSKRVRRLVALDEIVLKVKVLDSCEGKPVIVVDRGPWYRWALDRLGITYFHETFGNRNRIERLFREMKERTKRFYNNIGWTSCERMKLIM
jgi:putative transposase